MGIPKGRRVKLSVVEGQVIIAPIFNESPSLEEMLERFNPAIHGGEAMTTSHRLGAEHPKPEKP